MAALRGTARVGRPEEPLQRPAFVTGLNSYAVSLSSLRTIPSQRKGLTFYNLLKGSGHSMSCDLVPHMLLSREHGGNRHHKLRAIKSQQTAL